MKKLITKTKYQLKCKYYADDSGHIWSEKMGQFLKEYDDKNGYKKVSLSATDKTHRFSVHRLILETFQPVPNMQTLQVDHIDGDKANNALSNLRWITCKEHYKEGLKDTTTIPNFKSDCARDTLEEKKERAKLNNEKVLEIIKLLKSKKYSMKQIGDMYNVTATSICSIKNKRTWKHLTKNIDFD